jgi:hypothetical protein
MQASETLLVLEEIRGVKARYCRFLDTKNWEGLGGLFISDAVLDVREDTGMEPFVGREELVEQIRRSVIHAKTAHQVHSPEIKLLGADEATAIWAMQDRVVWSEGHSPLPNAQSITGFGHYHERYVRRGGIWQIASLKLTRLYVEMHR